MHLRRRFFYPQMSLAPIWNHRNIRAETPGGQLLKISRDRYRIRFDISLYPVSFLANTPFKITFSVSLKLIILNCSLCCLTSVAILSKYH